MADPFYRDEQGNRRVNPCTQVVYKGVILGAGEIIPEEKQNNEPENNGVENE